jgi:hypothetical protein
VKVTASGLSEGGRCSEHHLSQPIELIVRRALASLEVGERDHEVLDLAGVVEVDQPVVQVGSLSPWSIAPFVSKARVFIGR